MTLKIVETMGLRFLTRESSDRYQVEYVGRWAPQEFAVEVLQEDCHPKVIVDVGAHIGTFCIPIARAFPEATIYALEPHHETFEVLRSNLALNDITNVVPLRAALTAQGGSTRLYFAENAWEHTTRKDNREVSMAQKGVEVSAFSVTTLLETFSIAEVSFLQMNCEGGEFDLLTRDGIENMCRRGVKNVYAELHFGHIGDLPIDETLDMIVGSFEELDYSVHTFKRKAEKDDFRPSIWLSVFKNDLKSKDFESIDGFMHVKTRR